MWSTKYNATDEKQKQNTHQLQSKIICIKNKLKINKYVSKKKSKPYTEKAPQWDETEENYRLWS